MSLLKDEWQHLYFLPLPDTVSKKPHFVAADIVGGRLVVPKVTICWHRENRWPPGLKRVRKLTKVTTSRFRCPHCQASVLTHDMLVMHGRIHLCRCTLVGVSNKFHQPDTAELWKKIQRIYSKAEADADEFSLPPTGLHGLN